MLNSFLGCVQKCKVIANGLSWAPMPNDEREQEQGSSAKRSRVIRTSERGPDLVFFFFSVNEMGYVKIFELEITFLLPVKCIELDCHVQLHSLIMNFALQNFFFFFFRLAMPLRARNKTKNGSKGDSRDTVQLLTRPEIFCFHTEICKTN